MSLMKTSPAVFAVGNQYQIMVPVSEDSLMWVKIGDRIFPDQAAGLFRSMVHVHRMTVPMEVLDEAGEYTVCFQKMIDRKAYFPETGEVEEKRFSFRPAKGENLKCYHISDAHNAIDLPIEAAKTFEKEYGKIDFLVLNGDILNYSLSPEKYDYAYRIIEGITGGKIPVIFSRGNHDLRGQWSEKQADFFANKNGNFYYTVRLGDIWAIVLDCGEDKDDSADAYGGVVCCHLYREAQIGFLKEVIANAEKEYLAEGINHRVVIVHKPFTHQSKEEIFNIEKEIYQNWADLIRENIKPEFMMAGDEHRTCILSAGEEEFISHPCPIVIGSDINMPECFFAGAGYLFEKDSVRVVFTDTKKVISEHKVK